MASDIIKDISRFAASIKKLETQAKKMGIFMNDRELSECKCGFQEDVASDGRLITYKKGDKVKDTGLRFRKTAGAKYVCPVCKSVVMVNTDSLQKKREKGTDTFSRGMKTGSIPGRDI